MFWIALLPLSAQAHDGDAACTATSCPMPHTPITERWDTDSRRPPIDQRVPSHLRTATFALG